MIVQFNVRDFLDRAEMSYPERIGLVDEPDQPAEPWTPLTFAGLAARARAQAVGLDRLGVGRGERVAIVSHNSSRLLTSFYGVCGWGRILVPDQLPTGPGRDRVHRGALGGLRAAGRPGGRGRPGRHRRPPPVRAGGRERRGPVPRRRRRRRRGGPAGVAGRRGRHRHHQLHLGHHGPAQGCPADPPQLLGQRLPVRLAHGGLRPRRLPPHPAHVPCQRVGHAVGDHGHGLPPGGPAQGGRHRDPPAGANATG